MRVFHKGETIPREILRFDGQGVEALAVAGCRIEVTIDLARWVTVLRCNPGPGGHGISVDTSSNQGPWAAAPRPLELIGGDSFGEFKGAIKAVAGIDECWPFSGGMLEFTPGTIYVY